MFLSIIRISLSILIPSALGLVQKIHHINNSPQQCKLKEITYEEVSKLQPWTLRKIPINDTRSDDDSNYTGVSTKLDEVYDALQLSKCNVSRISSQSLSLSTNKNKHITRKDKIDNNLISNFRKLRINLKHKSNIMNVYVIPNNSDNNNYNNNKEDDGSIKNPFKNIHNALLKIRTYRKNNIHKQNNTMRIILRNGIHYLNNTLQLQRGKDNDDSNIVIMSYPGEFAWISGGILVSNLSWEPVMHSNNVTIYKTSIPISKELPDNADVTTMFGGGTELKDHTRYTLARVPNMDIERDMWGMDYEDHSFYSDTVLNWNLPSKSQQQSPDNIFIDLSNNSNPTGYIKNNSHMEGYNTFTTAAGGSCKSIWDVADNIDTTMNTNVSTISESTSYWCSPYSSGGWAEVDAYAATEAIPQIPTGMAWNMSHPDVQFLNNYLADSHDNENGTNAVLHAWHSQTWAVHMFQIQSINTSSHTMTFKSGVGSGSQGARNWCRCNQCYYAGALWTNSGRKKNWCRNDSNDTRLIGGSWFIEGLFSSLDYPNEFFFNTTSRELHIAVNETTHPPNSLVIPMLKELISISSLSHDKPISNVLLDKIGFRDTVSTYKEKWEVPSGGDWSFHRSAALHVQNSTHMHVHNCTFRRLNGNAFLLSGYNRYTYLQRSTFEYIGQNAAAAWGYTTNSYYNGTAGLQPRYTYIQQNFFHDIGIFQKQSAAWFQAKSALTFVEQNVMFNLPRAAININDGFGGGNIIQFNIIFNTCRESGDHGPINSWDRMPFLTDVLYSEEANNYNRNISSNNANDNNDKVLFSFDSLMNKIKHNLIIANYGASWAVDNDDGSSFYDIFDNVFLDSNGFKMDYGGHNSSFHNNIIVTKENDDYSNCLGTEAFLANVTDSYYNNTCFVRNNDIMNTNIPNHKSKSPTIVGNVDNCNVGYFVSYNNVYATATGNASFLCGEEMISVSTLAKNASTIGENDAVIILPDDTILLQIVKDKVFEIFSSKVAK